jgi:hypothetical protein
MWGRFVGGCLAFLKALLVVSVTFAALALINQLSFIAGLVAAAVVGITALIFCLVQSAPVRRVADRIWIGKRTGVALFIIAIFATYASGSDWLAQQRAEEAAAAAAQETKLQALRRTDPKQYLANLQAANDPRWEVEFKTLDPTGYAAYLADLKTKQEQERQASIQRLTQQLASTKPDDLEGRYNIYSSLMGLDPSNKDYAAKRAAIEPAVLKARREKLEAEDQLKHKLGQYVACVYSQELIKSVLKAPSTADFPGCAWSANEYWYQESATNAVLMGYVDAQNGFGAKLRNHYAVYFVKRSDGWTTCDFKMPAYSGDDKLPAKCRGPELRGMPTKAPAGSHAPHLTGNGANDFLLTSSPSVQATTLGKVVGDGCEGKVAFYQGFGKDPGLGNGLGFWDVKCADERTFVVQVNPDGNGKVLECAAMEAIHAGHCFQKFPGQ